MKPDSQTLPSRYLTALRKHLKGGSDTNLKAARRLGLQAIKEGLQILDLAKVHEQALSVLIQPHDLEAKSDRLVQSAGLFFAESITPMEETHRGALEANVSLQQIVESLRLSTEQLAASNDELKREIAERAAVELSLRTSELTSSQLLKKSSVMQEELRHLSRRLFTIQEEERRRISRDLHDVIAQSLTGINMRLAALKTEATSNSKVFNKSIGVTQRVVARSVQMVHRFARDLRPTVLDDFGLIPALESYLKDYIKQTGVRVHLTTFASIETFNSNVLTALYRVTQEALANVSRHAKASEAHIIINNHQGVLGMEIHDNGCGFLIKPGAFPKSGRRLGLLGMRERIEMLGGTFRVESKPGSGTQLLISVPPPTAKTARKQPVKRLTNSPS
jgi:signal transduction histidine kinase